MVVAHLAPPLPFLPSERYGTPVFGLLLTWAGDIGEGLKVIAPLRAVGSPLADVVRPVPYRTVQTMVDGSAPHGSPSYWRSHRIPELSDAVIDRIVAGVETITSPLSLLNGWMIGGAASRVAADATAVGDREAGFELRHIAVWRPGDPEPEQHRAWVRHAWDAMRPLTAGRQYATYLADEGADRVRAAYGVRLARLAALKDRYDPTNVFRLNANIPTTEGAMQ